MRDKKEIKKKRKQPGEKTSFYKSQPSEKQTSSFLSYSHLTGHSNEV